jgi:hypothetical protein
MTIGNRNRQGNRRSTSTLAIDAQAAIDPVVDPRPPLAAADVSEKFLQLRVMIGDLVAGRSGRSGASAREGKGRQETKPVASGGHCSIVMSILAFI